MPASDPSSNKKYSAYPSNPAVTLPLLLGLSRSSGYSGKVGWSTVANNVPAAGVGVGGVDNNDDDANNDKNKVGEKGEGQVKGVNKSSRDVETEAAPGGGENGGIEGGTNTSLQTSSAESQIIIANNTASATTCTSQTTTSASQVIQTKPANRLLQTALCQYQAQKIIHCALVNWTRCWRRHREQKKHDKKRQSGEGENDGKESGMSGEAKGGVVEDGKNVRGEAAEGDGNPKIDHGDSAKGVSTNKGGQGRSSGSSHFLFQSLLHPSINVRRAAGRMIVHSVHSIDDLDGGGGNVVGGGVGGDCGVATAAHVKRGGRGDCKMPRESLLEVLLGLLDDLMFPPSPPSSSLSASASSFPSSTTIPSSTHDAMKLDLNNTTSNIHDNISTSNIININNNTGNTKVQNKSTLHHVQGGDPAIQLMGMITSLVCEGGFPNVVVEMELMKLAADLNAVGSVSGSDNGSGSGNGGDKGNKTNKEQQQRQQQSKQEEEPILCNSRLNHMSSYSIESFVTAGGLRWACGSIVRLVHLLVHGGTNGSSDGIVVPVGGGGGGVGNMDGGSEEAGEATTSPSSLFSRIGEAAGGIHPLDDITAEMIQTRLLLLIDLVYRLVLYGSVPAAVPCSVGGVGNNGNSGNGGRGDENKGDLEGRDGSTTTYATARSSSSRAKKKPSSVLHDLEESLAGGETSRTSSLRSTIRNTTSSPAHAGTRHYHLPTGSSSSSGNQGKRLIGGIAGGAGGRGEGEGPSSNSTNQAVADENKSRKERRQSTLERVHRIFWSSNLPAAICHPSIHKVRNGDRVDFPCALTLLGAEPPSSNIKEDSLHEQYHGNFSPLACLIAAYEILRAPPNSVPTLASNGQLRGMDKGISTLGRMVDPAAGAAVVVTEPEIPWGVTSLLGGLRHGVVNACDLGKGAAARLSGNKRRDRSASHASQDSHRSRSSNSSLRRNRLQGASPAAAGASNRTSAGVSASANDAASHRAKRARTSGVASLLERLTQGDSSLSDLRGSLVGSSGAAGGLGVGLPTSSASAAGLTSSSLFGSRYRAAMMESMLGLGAGRDSLSVAGLLSDVTRIQASRGSAAAAAAGSVLAASLSSSPNRPSIPRSLADSGNQPPREEDDWRIVGEEDVHDEDMDTVDHDDEIIDEEDGEVCDEDVESDLDEHDQGGGGAGEGGEDDDDDDGSCDDEDEEHYDEEKSDSEPEDNGQFDDAVIVLDEVANVTAANSARASSSRHNPHRQPAPSHAQRGTGCNSSGAVRVAESNSSSHFDKKEREQAYICAAMQVLGAQYPDMVRARKMFANHSRDTPNTLSVLARLPALIQPPLLTTTAEQSLLRSMCDIVKPPRKPLNLKIFMRRAPTQEEFFRGSLSRNPITLSSLSAGTSSSQGAGGDDRRVSGAGIGNDSSSHGNNEPRVRDLRQHIADDLQMSDSAELLELLVANKILDMNLKLRVVQQVLWKKYVMENSTSASSLISGAGPGHQMINTGSGLSMIFSSSSLTARSRAGGSDDSLLSSLPPMVVTYRLAGVDGEATEDKVEMEDLQDPEAPGSVSPRSKERQMEKEFGITRIITRGRGVSIILSSIEATISELLRRIRRDEVIRRRQLRSGSQDNSSSTDGNVTREKFAKSAPCPGLVVLRHCANLAQNRKKLLAARAPTVLLRMLLDILNAMNRNPKRQNVSAIAMQPSESMDVDEEENLSNDNAASEAASSSNARSKHHGSHMEGNPTTDMLQEIIEMLASDISAEVAENPNEVSRSGSFVNISEAEMQQNASASQEDDGTLPLVLKSLHSTQLSPPLRKVIAKLLPFLTYGQVSQSKELASYFDRYVIVESLGMMEVFQQGNRSILMTTFVETAINLPPVSVCDNLRKELIKNGFVSKVRSFIMKDAPAKPAPWSPALYSKSSKQSNESAKSELSEEWRRYFNRPGLAYAIKVLTGLCSKHPQTQLLLSEDVNEVTTAEKLDLITLCHWIESTSDNTTSRIKTNDLGILAETLLDELKQDNKVTAEKINAIRKKTRDRKREIAEERRNKALVGMSAFGPIAGSATAENNTTAASSAAVRGNAAASESRASVLASMFGLSAFSSSLLSSGTQTRSSTSAKNQNNERKEQPAWMAEMEAMDDEAFACAVCQEGRTLQPSELLGLYAFIKKVTISSSQCGAKSDIDGTNMLLALPTSPPSSLSTSDMISLFRKGKSAADALQGSHALSAMSISSVTSSRSNYFITTVSAGNAIHCSCHSKAKAADRSNPKAPKSEWEGATLRNSRVTCNVILPLVSSKVSEVPLMAVETALADVNTVVTNTLGIRPKSMLWVVLHDLRFLLLRMAYGEALNADCGGGSSSSNFLLLLYQLYTADMYAINAEHDESPEVSKHARGLSSGFLAAVDIVEAPGFDRHEPRSKRLERGVADAAPMASLCSILFFNAQENEESEGDGAAAGKCSDKTPSPKRQWEMHKDKFLTGLIKCAGHRHSLGITDSGCVTSRGISTGRKNVERARSFADWGNSNSNNEDLSMSASTTAGARKRRGASMINEYSAALRPMITMYTIFDQLSREFVVNNDDESTDSSSGRLAAKLDECYKAENIQELIRVADITMDHEKMCKIFERGALV